MKSLCSGIDWMDERMRKNKLTNLYFRFCILFIHVCGNCLIILERKFWVRDDDDDFLVFVIINRNDIDWFFFILNKKWLSEEMFVYSKWCTKCKVNVNMLTCLNYFDDFKCCLDWFELILECELSWNSSE